MVHRYILTIPYCSNTFSVSRSVFLWCISGTLTNFLVHISPVLRSFVLTYRPVLEMCTFFHSEMYHFLFFDVLKIYANTSMLTSNI